MQGWKSRVQKSLLNLVTEPMKKVERRLKSKDEKEKHKKKKSRNEEEAESTRNEEEAESTSDVLFISHD